jgi:hypothetical protein
MDIADAIRQLGQDMGLPLRLDERRACRLVFDGRIEVDIEAPEGRGDAVFLSSAVGIVPPGGREAVFQTLLEGNLFGRGTGGGVLALDTAYNEIVLQHALAMDKVQYQEFVKTLEQFVLHASTWIERLAKFSHGRPAEPPTAESALPSSMLRV